MDFIFFQHEIYAKSQKSITDLKLSDVRRVGEVAVIVLTFI